MSDSEIRIISRWKCVPERIRSEWKRNAGLSEQFEKPPKEMFEVVIITRNSNGKASSQTRHLTDRQLASIPVRRESHLEQLLIAEIQSQSCALLIREREGVYDLLIEPDEVDRLKPVKIVVHQAEGERIVGVMREEAPGTMEDEIGSRVIFLENASY